MRILSTIFSDIFICLKLFQKEKFKKIFFISIAHLSLIICTLFTEVNNLIHNFSLHLSHIYVLHALIGIFLSCPIRISSIILSVLICKQEEWTSQVRYAFISLVPSSVPGSGLNE